MQPIEPVYHRLREQAVLPQAAISSIPDTPSSAVDDSIANRTTLTLRDCTAHRMSQCRTTLKTRSTPSSWSVPIDHAATPYPTKSRPVGNRHAQKVAKRDRHIL